MSLASLFTFETKDIRGTVKTNLRLGRIVGSAFGGLFALALFFGSFSTVGPGQRGITVTLGKTGDTVLGEGPHFKLPFISEIRVMSIRVHKSEDQSEAATKDLQRVNAKVALNWTINPESVGRMLREVGDETSIENNIIAPAVSEVLKAATAKLTAEEVLLRRIELKTNIDESLIKRLTSYGLIIKDISLVDLDFDKEFNKAVEEKQIAEQKSKQAEYDAQRAIKEADAEVNRAKGKSEAQKLMRSTITPEILRQQAIEKWDGHFPQFMGGGTLPFINLNTSAKTAE